MIKLMLDIPLFPVKMLKRSLSFCVLQSPMNVYIVCSCLSIRILMVNKYDKQQLQSGRICLQKEPVLLIMKGLILSVPRPNRFRGYSDQPGVRPSFPRSTLIPLDIDRDEEDQ